MPVLIQFIVYPVLILIVAIFLLITVPRDKLRLLLPYGVVLGGLLDFVDDTIMGKLFKVIAFSELGLFDASGHLIFAPLAWTLIIVFYLYFWPDDNKYLGYLYGFAWALLATAFSQVVYKAELFSYAPWFYPLPMLLTFVLRFAFITWVAQRCKLIRLE